jgi:hypothetical protein
MLKNNEGLVAVARAALAGKGRKCQETLGDAPRSMEFTYPNDYTEGMEYSCSITVDPESGTRVVLYKMDKLVDEFALDNGNSRGSKMENLFKSIEVFNKFCVTCDDDLAYVGALRSRFTPVATNTSRSVFLA